MKRSITGTGFFLIAGLAAIFLFQSCGSGKQGGDEQADRFSLVAGYIESHGDFVNSEKAPGAIGIDAVLNYKGEKMYVIDLRTPREFESGHLKNAVNVQMEDILEYFENIIDPPSFDTIAILSSDGQEAMFTVTLLQILGYHNVYGVKTGMAWHSRFADKYWLSHLSSAYQDSLSTGPSPVRREYPFAIIESADTDAYQLIRTRVKDLLSKGISSYYAGAKEAFENPDKYYIVNYWPPEEYAIGHIPGSFQYTPRQSLGRSSGLHTLPPDKPILVYCHMGNLSASAVAYLRLLGYDAWSIPFGTHSFMYDVLKEKLGRNYFDKSMVFDYPLQDKNSSGNGKSDIPKLVPVKSQGGC